MPTSPSLSRVFARGRTRAPDRLRVEQVTAVTRRASVFACGSLVSCLVVVTEFWPVASHRYLLSLLSVLAVCQCLAVGRSLWYAKSSRGMSRWSFHVQCVMAASVATTWATVPCVLMPLASADQQQMLVAIACALVAASVLLAPVLPAALLFAAIGTAGPVFASLSAHRSTALAQCVLDLVYLAVASGVVVQQGRDFSRRVQNELTVLEQGDIIKMLLHDFEEDATDWMWETDSTLRLQRIPDRLASALGLDPNVLQGASLRGWVGRSARETGSDVGDAVALLSALTDRTPFRDLQVQVLAGTEPRWFSFSGRPVFASNGEFLGFRGVGSDVTAIRESDERIAYLARHDSLTGLPNRTQFREALARACARSAPLTLLLLDLDGFKSVNDTLGHPVGDALLVAVADRLRSCLAEGDLAARLGGDEFAIMHASDQAASAERLARRLIDSVSKPYRLGAVPANIGLSIGLVSPRDAGLDPEQLLKGADLALYRSKADGRGTWHAFTPAMAARAQERQAMQADLKRAIAGDELILDFQPIVDMSSGQVTGAEALVRWLHPTRGRIAPGDFIPIAEESGLILPLGEWVLRRACGEAATWQSDARVAVNLSPVQFRDPALLALIDRILVETGLSPHRLELEITESVFLDAVDATVACLNALRARGIHIALDDFGTGYSSLSYLRSFPFDKVKIDKSFIRDLGGNDDAVAIVGAIIGMAGSLGMRTTGEGVETTQQADILQRSGCSQVQGYLFGRPCAPQTIRAIMHPACEIRTTRALGAPVPEHSGVRKHILPVL